MENKPEILVVEDEDKINDRIERVLKNNHYGVLKAKNGVEALMMIQSYCPDMILLDLGLPDMEGTEIIHKVREWSQEPIIVISAREDAQDKVEVLDSGADDYVTKPFSESELLARIRAAIRHSMKMMGTTIGNNVFETGDLRVDFDRREVTMAGKVIHLTQMEYRLMTLLCQNAGRVMTYNSIICSLWGPQASLDNRKLRVTIAHIRHKIEKNPAEPQYIFTEIGIGYRMKE